MDKIVVKGKIISRVNDKAVINLINKTIGNNIGHVGVYNHGNLFSDGKGMLFCSEGFTNINA